MKGKEKATYIKNVILPGFVVSGLTGVITGAAIFFFKWGAEFIGAASTHIYGLILENPAFVPLMFIALVGLALCMAFIIKGAPAVAGGGIPTAEGILRGLLRSGGAHVSEYDSKQLHSFFCRTSSRQRGPERAYRHFFGTWHKQSFQS